jgi:hypothetical protein
MDREVVSAETDADAGLWAELEKEVADEAAPEIESEPAAKAEPEAEPAPEPEKPEAAKGPIPYEELDKRYKQLQGALGEERGTRKQLSERLQNMETLIRQITGKADQPAQGQKPAAEQTIPDINEDPVGHFAAKLAATEAKLKAIEEASTKTVETITREKQEQQFWSTVERSEIEMRSTAPDYDDAVGFLEQSRVRELEAMIPDTDQSLALAHQNGFRTVEDLRIAMLNRDRVAVATQALQMGMSPAQLYYNLAKQRGFTGPAPKAPAAPMKPTAQAKQPNAIAATKKGQEASRSLSGGGAGASDGAVSLEDLAEMYIEDPDRADQMFKSMKAKGLLG